MIWRWDLRPLEALMDRLKHEPGSLWGADERGDLSWFHWSTDTSLLASLIDAVNQNTLARGGKKIKPSQKVERPKQEKRKTGPRFDPYAPVRSMNLAALIPEDQ